MISEDKLKEIIQSVVSEVVNANPANNSSVSRETTTGGNIASTTVTDGILDDITTTDMREIYAVPNAFNEKELRYSKKNTQARLGIWRAGSRYKTDTALRFRADHAAAMDAVFNDVPDEFVNELNVVSVQTQCSSRDEYLTRPDLGRKLTPEAVSEIKSKCKQNSKVQVVIGDGLSSTAIVANIKQVLPAFLQGLKSYGIETGTPVFIKYCRVGAMDEVTEALSNEVTVNFIGERPGLATAESMSAYITYKGFPGIAEAKRTVVSNIHSGGTPPLEAGAHVAHIVEEMLKQKASGLDFKMDK